MNKKIIISFLIIILIAAVSVYLFQNRENHFEENIIVGGDADEHGCIGSAGYIWCEAKNKCIRPWEEDCESSIANPASVKCSEDGGQVVIKELPSGDEYGACSFEDNRWCEEWALYRGECPSGGVKITGYDNEAQIYCAISGGDVNMNENTCTFSDGKMCDIDDYYNQTCIK